MGIRRGVVTAVALAMAVACVATACSSSSGTPKPTATSTSPSTTVTIPPPSTTPTTAASTTTSATPTSTSPSPTPPPKPKPTDPLTGGAPSSNPVMAVKIDNTAAGFPQFGITKADIIYTEQVEGGLTRLIAIFHTSLPTEVGAVRSIRSTDLQLLPSFGRPILVASGGAPRWVRALRESVLVGVTNDSGAGGFWRSQYGDGTHNLHANLETIAKEHPGKGKAQYMGFRFAAKDPGLASARKVSDIVVTMLAMQFEFTYADGKYLAHHSGTPYTDHRGDRVYVNNVIVEHVHDAPDGQLDPIGNPSYRSTTIGSGKFTLYRDGRAIEGTWSRKSLSDPTTYLGTDGKPVLLAPGKTWVLLAPQTSTFNKV